ncbi:MAG: hypothetical protein ACI3YI_13025 [Bacteroidaceae bacterium]
MLSTTERIVLQGKEQGNDIIGLWRNEILLGKGLTEDEARKIYEAKKYAVENNGTDYAEINYENLYEPVNNNPFVYQRATGEKVEKAFELYEISEAVAKKFKRLGLL